MAMRRDFLNDISDIISKIEKTNESIEKITAEMKTKDFSNLSDSQLDHFFRYKIKLNFLTGFTLLQNCINLSANKDISEKLGLEQIMLMLVQNLCNLCNQFIQSNRVINDKVEYQMRVNRQLRNFFWELKDLAQEAIDNGQHKNQWSNCIAAFDRTSINLNMILIEATAKMIDSAKSNYVSPKELHTKYCDNLYYLNDLEPYMDVLYAVQEKSKADHNLGFINRNTYNTNWYFYSQTKNTDYLKAVHEATVSQQKLCKAAWRTHDVESINIVVEMLTELESKHFFNDVTFYKIALHQTNELLKVKRYFETYLAYMIRLCENICAEINKSLAAYDQSHLPEALDSVKKFISVIQEYFPQWDSLESFVPIYLKFLDALFDSKQYTEANKYLRAYQEKFNSNVDISAENREKNKRIH